MSALLLWLLLARFSSLVVADTPWQYVEQYGCYKNYCWSMCHGAGQEVFGRAVAPDWCYTTGPDGYSQNYDYVPCSNKNECSPDWKCAGPCSV